MRNSGNQMSVSGNAGAGGRDLRKWERVEIERSNVEASHQNPSALKADAA